MPRAIPTTIKVGPLVYDVIVDALAIAKEQIEARELRLAACDEKNLRITLDPTLPPGMARATLLHEVLHAVTALTTLAKIVVDTDPEETDERIVGILEMPLLAVLRDNPQLVAYLTAA